MKSEKFEEILSERIRKIKNILASKADEYGSVDRLHNFKVAARLNHESPLDSAWGMATKHLVCIVDMVKGDSPITPYMVDEKIGDMINYLILMEAICLEQIEERSD